MAKPKRASPGIGHNGEPPKAGAVNAALAMEIIDQEKMAELRELRKRHRKIAEGAGVPLAELDDLYKRRDETPDDILAFFKRKWSVFSVFFSDLGKQYDLFAPKAAAPEVRATYRHAGLMAALKGEDPAPPPTVAGEELQEWQDGYNEGAAARKGSEEQRSKELAELLAHALGNADKGIVTDGTGKGPKGKAKDVAKQAAADFKADNPDYGQPDWKGFGADPKDWTPAERQVFDTWFAKVPKGASVAIAHEGVREAFVEASKAAKDEFEEAPPAELEKQTPRRAAAAAKQGATT